MRTPLDPEIADLELRRQPPVRAGRVDADDVELGQRAHVLRRAERQVQVDAVADDGGAHVHLAQVAVEAAHAQHVGAAPVLGAGRVRGAAMQML